MLRVSDGKSTRTVQWSTALCWLAALAWTLTESAAHAEQPVVAAPQSLGVQSPGVQPAPTRSGSLEGAMRSARLNVDLDASADYYRGYRDALRDAARLSRPYAPYRGRANTSANANTSAYRTWPPSEAQIANATAARQRDTNDRPRDSARPMQEGERAEGPLNQVGQSNRERRTDRPTGVTSERPRVATDGLGEEHRSPAEARGGSNGRLPNPLPMPQSSVPQSYLLPPTSNSQSFASGFDPAGRPR